MDLFKTYTEMDIIRMKELIELWQHYVKYG
jgi:hypothetical protein